MTETTPPGSNLAPRRMTGGQALLAVAGMEVFSGKWGLGCTYLHPVYQNLGDGFVQARPRFSANLMFIF